MAALHSLCFSSPHLHLPSKPTPLVVPAIATSASPAIVLPDLPSDIKEKILSLELMGIDSTKALSLNPSLHSSPLPSLHSLISFLLSRGIHHKDLRRIVGMCPSLLTADIRTHVAPVFHFLSQDLGVPDSHFRKPINKCPRLLTSSVRDQLRPALFYLRRLGFEDTRSLAYRDPVLLVSSVERTLMPKLEFLRSVGFTRDEAVGMVLRCPGLFTFSIENNFKPKLEYFLEEMKGEIGELREFPQFFTFSLEKRIKPRNRRAVESTVDVPLAAMLKATDEEFEWLIQGREASS